MNKKIDKLFSHDSLPSLFGAEFSSKKLDWKKLKGVEFEKIGRILACHLIIEHHINKYIELSTPKKFDWSEAKMTFTQKLKLLKKDPILKQYEFGKNATIINKIRNKFSHNLEVIIDNNDITSLSETFTAFEREHPPKERGEHHEFSDIAMIERFTGLFCAFFAGACSSMVGYFDARSKESATKYTR